MADEQPVESALRTPRPSPLEGEGRPTATTKRTVEAGGVLALLLGTIHQHDVAPDSVGPPNYEARNRLILFAISAAVTEGVPVGILHDPDEPEWPVVMFELPTGQVGWHLPHHPVPYDGHDTRTKYERIRAFQEGRRG